jgi:TolA-binding protein
VAAVLLLAAGTTVLLRTRTTDRTTIAPNDSPDGFGTSAAPRLRLEKPEVVLPAATALVLRGRDADEGQQYLGEFGVAIDLYRANDYAKAISRLTAVRNRYPDAAEPPFYLGASRLLARDPQGAIESFERAATLSVDERRDEALWYLAVAQERAGLLDGARRTLQDLCSRIGPRQQNACAASGAFGDVNPAARP